MRAIRQLLAIFSLLFCISHSFVAQQSQTAREPRPEIRYVDIGGYKLRLQVAGSGTPTVVLDCGIGDRLEVWNDVVPAIARFTRVIGYDRAGLGKSEMGPEPRSFARIASELHTLLHRSNIAPPYILVGHSMGGANIRAFASLFRDEVAGMVFVDPLNENISQVCWACS